MSNVDTAQEMSELSWFKYFQVVFTCSGLLSVKIISPQEFFFQSHQNIFCSVLTKEHFGVLIWSGMVLWGDGSFIGLRLDCFSLLHVDFFQRSKQNDKMIMTLYYNKEVIKKSKVVSSNLKTSYLIIPKFCFCQRRVCCLLSYYGLFVEHQMRKVLWKRSRDNNTNG